MELSYGSLTIGTTRSFARHLMPRLLSRFQQTYPGIKLVLKEGSSQEIADAVAEYRCDLGIIARLPEMNKLKVIPYSKEKFCLVASPNHRFAHSREVSYRDLEDEAIIIREEGSGSRYAILSLLRSRGVAPSILIEAGSNEFIKEYVMQGRGISFLYRPEIEIEAKMGLLKPLRIRGGPIFVQTDIVLPRDTPLSPATEAFLKIVEAMDPGWKPETMRS